MPIPGQFFKGNLLLVDLTKLKGTKKKKKKLLSRTLKNDELLNEMKKINRNISLLPHSEHSGGGSDE